MAIALEPTVPPAPVQRFTVQQYHRMIESGVLTENDRVELLAGWIIPKMPHNAAHRIAIPLTQRVLTNVLPANWFLGVQLPVTTADSEPEPDLAVVRGNPRDYPHGSPGPQDVALLIEVSDTTLSFDRHFKGPLYARALFPVYWIVNLPEGIVEVYTDPSGPTEQPGYRQRQDYGPDDAVPLVLDGREIARIAVRDLLP
jgi:Uma2 family endonuclease